MIELRRFNNNRNVNIEEEEEEEYKYIQNTTKLLNATPVLYRDFITPPSVNSGYGGNMTRKIKLHPLVFILTGLFLVMYTIKFIRVYFHNASVQQALIQHGEPLSCAEYKRSYSRMSHNDATDISIPSFKDAAGAFWSLIGYNIKSKECEEWHRKVNEWNIPDPSDIAWLVVTSTFTQPVTLLMDGLSTSIENFFNKQSMLVTVLIFALVGYICKLYFLNGYNLKNLN